MIWVITLARELSKRGEARFARGKDLTAGPSGKWRYRVGDYRVLCEIGIAELIVLTIEVGHRRDIYK